MTPRSSAALRAASVRRPDRKVKLSLDAVSCPRQLAPDLQAKARPRDWARNKQFMLRLGTLRWQAAAAGPRP
jgi:hypothetical protein